MFKSTAILKLTLYPRLDKSERDRRGNFALINRKKIKFDPPPVYDVDIWFKSHNARVEDINEFWGFSNRIETRNNVNWYCSFDQVLWAIGARVTVKRDTCVGRVATRTRAVPPLYPKNKNHDKRRKNCFACTRDPDEGRDERKPYVQIGINEDSENVQRKSGSAATRFEGWAQIFCIRVKEIRTPILRVKI